MESKSTTEIRADLHERAKRGQALNDDEREAVIKAEASLGGEEIGRGFADEAPARTCVILHLLRFLLISASGSLPRGQSSSVCVGFKSRRRAQPATRSGHEG